MGLSGIPYVAAILSTLAGPAVSGRGQRRKPVGPLHHAIAMSAGRSNGRGAVVVLPRDGRGVTQDHWYVQGGLRRSQHCRGGQAMPEESAFLAHGPGGAGCVPIPLRRCSGSQAVRRSNSPKPVDVLPFPAARTVQPGDSGRTSASGRPGDHNPARWMSSCPPGGSAAGKCCHPG